MNLDPAKVLVILVIALIVLGPERLPRVARQLGMFLHEISQQRNRIVDQIRDQLPELPESGSVRSFLFDSLAREQGRAVPDQTGRLGPRSEPRALERVQYVSAGEHAEPDDPSMN